MKLILAAESLDDGIKRRQKVEARSQDVQAGDIEPKQRKDKRTYIWVYVHTHMTVYGHIIVLVT